MANLHLVTGYAGREHVTAADQGAFNIAMLGSGQFVINKGNKLSASVVSNNQVRVLDGDIYMQGRFIRLNEGSYVDLVIENGAQGKLRNDLIVARYTKDVETGVEEVNLVVIKGTAAASNPKDPTYSNGNIAAGSGYLHDMPLYRVPIDGLNVKTLVPLFTVKNWLIPTSTEDLGAINTEDKPSGSWTGNKNIPRTINTGGTGDVIAVRVILGTGENGPIYYINGDVAIKCVLDGTVQVLTDHATFYDGVLTINHLNMNGSTTGGNMKYYYQVL